MATAENSRGRLPRAGDVKPLPAAGGTDGMLSPQDTLLLPHPCRHSPGDGTEQPGCGHQARGRRATASASHLHCCLFPVSVRRARRLRRCLPAEPMQVL